MRVVKSNDRKNIHSIYLNEITRTVFKQSNFTLLDFVRPGKAIFFKEKKENQ